MSRTRPELRTASSTAIAVVSIAVCVGCVTAFGASAPAPARHETRTELNGEREMVASLLSCISEAARELCGKHVAASGRETPRWTLLGTGSCRTASLPVLIDGPPAQGVVLRLLDLPPPTPGC